MQVSRQITTPVPDHSVFLQAGYTSCRSNNSVKALKATLRNKKIQTRLTSTLSISMKFFSAFCTFCGILETVSSMPCSTAYLRSPTVGCSSWHSQQGRRTVKPPITAKRVRHKMAEARVNSSPILPNQTQRSSFAVIGYTEARRGRKSPMTSLTCHLL